MQSTRLGDLTHQFWKEACTKPSRVPHKSVPQECKKHLWPHSGSWTLSWLHSTFHWPFFNHPNSTRIIYPIAGRLHSHAPSCLRCRSRLRVSVSLPSLAPSWGGLNQVPLPRSLKSLSFGDRFNHALEAGCAAPCARRSSPFRSLARSPGCTGGRPKAVAGEIGSMGSGHRPVHPARGDGGSPYSNAYVPVWRRRNTKMRQMEDCYQHHCTKLVRVV